MSDSKQDQMDKATSDAEKLDLRDYNLDDLSIWKDADKLNDSGRKTTDEIDTGNKKPTK